MRPAGPGPPGGPGGGGGPGGWLANMPLSEPAMARRGGGAAAAQAPRGGSRRRARGCPAPPGLPRPRGASASAAPGPPLLRRRAGTSDRGRGRRLTQRQPELPPVAPRVKRYRGEAEKATASFPAGPAFSCQAPAGVSTSSAPLVTDQRLAIKKPTHPLGPDPPNSQ